ncbi:hypothetical protein [Ralstonia pseudosolanacearum]|uniref:hypothetical protein n=1 Tax=Ralstonia pseudosolanacearum TaxID=1310165 RepID=UPI002674859F|nr:hypothetical protein [Ralstonia pseudosolanacearum]MDO3547173.1 hypothetical protein [Ralstonia pseudosolanacearum]MDO3582001.1 hypothetical protein [Ralstonia pseudosolanacearum]
MGMEKVFFEDGLSTLERDAALLEAAGRPEKAAQIRRDVAKLRRKHDSIQAGLADRRAAADARVGDMVSSMIAALEQRVASVPFR